MRKILIPLLTLACLCAFSFAQASVDMSGWSESPRVMFGPNDLDAVRAKLIREPYRTLYQRVFSRANQGYDLSDHSVNAEQSKGNIAKAAAFVYAMDRLVDGGEPVAFATPEDRAVYGQRAEELLVNMYGKSRMDSLQNAVLDIHTAQELQLYVTAFDILRGAGYPFADRQAVADRLGDFAADFYKDWELDQAVPSAAYNNNHASKSWAALSVAAAALHDLVSDDGTGDFAGFRNPQDWIDEGVRRLDLHLLDSLTARDGTFGEGPPYFTYSAINHLPALRMLHRLSNGGQGMTVNGFDHGDLYTRRMHKRLHEWMVRQIMPDGSQPHYDDSSPGGRYMFGEVVDIDPELGRLNRWAWEWQGQYPWASGSVNQEADTIVAYDDGVEPLSPHELGWSPNQFLYDGGLAIFRSAWEDRDALYMIMTAEHGKARCWTVDRWGEEYDGAGGHEHPDPLAVHLMAYGENLLLDSGYMGWPDHGMVNHAKNHNLILVDGQGAARPEFIIPELIQDENGNWVVKEGVEGGWVPGSDGSAELIDWFDGAALAYAAGRTSYFKDAPPTTLERHVLFVRKRYFILFDSAEADDEQSHTYTILWHGNGGGDSGGIFDQIPYGGSWIRGEARVDVKVSASNGDIAWETADDIHDPGNRVPHTHTLIKGSVEGRGARFISIVTPQPRTSSELTASPYGGGGWLIDDTQTVSERCEGAVLKNESPTPDAMCGYTSDGEGFFVSTLFGKLDQAFVFNGRSIRVQSDDAPKAELSKPARLHLAYEYDEADGVTRLSGHAFALDWPEDGLTLDLALESEPDLDALQSHGVCGFAWDAPSKTLRLTLMREGAFDVRFDLGENAVAPVARIEPDGGTVATGERVELSAAPSCVNAVSDSAEIEYTFSLSEAPPFSETLLTDNGDGSAWFVPDMLGIYIVTLAIPDEDAIKVRFVAEAPAPVDGDMDQESEIDSETESDALNDGDLEPEADTIADGDGDTPEMEPEGVDGDESPAIDGDSETIAPPKRGGGGGCNASGHGSAEALLLLILSLLALIGRRRLS